MSGVEPREAPKYFCWVQLDYETAIMMQLCFMLNYMHKNKLYDLAIVQGSWLFEKA